jgi:hypothetical protein
MTPESRLKAQVELFLSELGYIPLRLNVFQVFTRDGIPIRTGLPKGCSDIVAIQSGTGRAVFVETKVKPRKPTAEQLNFIEVMRKQGAIAGVVYSIDELKKLLINVK